MIVVFYASLGYASASYCKDLFLTEIELRSIASAIASAQLSLDTNPLIQSDPMYRFIIMDKLQREVEQFISLDNENSARIYQEEILKIQRLQFREKNRELKPSIKKQKEELNILKNFSVVLADHQREILEMNISKDFNFLVTKSADKKAKIISLKKNQVLYDLDSVENFRISSNSKFLSVWALDQSTNIYKVRVVEIDTGTDIFNIELKSVIDVRISSDGKYLFIDALVSEGKWPRTALVYDLKTNNLIKTRENNQAVVFGNTNNLVGFSQSKDWGEWNFLNLDSGALISTVKNKLDFSKKILKKLATLSKATVQSGELSSDDRFLVTVTFVDGKYLLKVNDLKLETEIVELTYRSETTVKMDIQHDRLFIKDAGKALQVLELSSGKNLYEIKVDRGILLKYDFNKDYLIASFYVSANGSFKHVTKMFDVNSGREIFQIDNQLHELKSIAFSPDSKLLALGYKDGIIEVFDTKTREKYIEDFQLHEKGITDLYFDSESRVLYSSSASDHNVKATDLKYFIGL
jgi:WD40 repeat protein